MTRGFLDLSRRLIAVLLLGALALPGALELATHDRDLIAFGQDHLEAPTSQHHGDDCQSNVSPGPRSISVNSSAPLLSPATCREGSLPPVTDVVGQEPRQPARSRAPPPFAGSAQ